MLLGSVHTNDLYLAWLLSAGFLCFVLFEKRPVLQGSLAAFFLWFGFYVKLWAVYLLPAIGAYYLIRLARNRTWQGLLSFSTASLVLHGMTGAFWKMKMGTFFPFITTHSATYPANELAPTLFSLLMQYPKMIFVGSEFGTTLFGYVPYLLIVLILAKAVLPLFTQKLPDGFRFDKWDAYLLVYYGSFFIFLNFFPNSFKFDQYYSAPRIFRYLAPMSFPMALHLGKLLVDFSKAGVPWISSVRKPEQALLVILAALIPLNLYQAADATKAGRQYRNALMGILQEVKRQSPPRLLSEYWMGFFIHNVYLKSQSDRIDSTPLFNLHLFSDYENWLNRRQSSFPEGAMLITGLGSYVYYGAHYDGFRLEHFSRDLDPRWQPVGEYGTLSYLPTPESARLWRWSGGTVATTQDAPVRKGDFPKGSDPEALFKEGMRLFDKDDCPKAKDYFKKIIDSFPDRHQTADARYFYSVCYFRMGDWESTIEEFTKLIERYPDSIWVAGAHFHIGLSYKQLEDYKRARKEFEYVIDHFPSDPNMVNLSKDQIKQLPEEPGGILRRLFKG